MLRTATLLSIACCALALAARTSLAADATKYTLRYQFRPGETVRWEVEHRATTRTTISGTTRATETVSKSVKAWKVVDVAADGSATFEHMVESVDMQQEMTGVESVRYNSLEDEKVPPGFDHVAASVGVPLSILTIDARGEVTKRQYKKTPAGRESRGNITVPFPEEPIAVGHTWSFPHTVDVKLNSGGFKRVKTEQTFKLLSVKTGVATIELSTEILTPVTDPQLESQLVQLESAGKIRFDIARGRVLGQQMGLDKRVVGFSGPASSIDYATRFHEKLLPAAVRTASRGGATQR